MRLTEGGSLDEEVVVESEHYIFVFFFLREDER
jgi:hypothetical protein